MKLNHEYLVNDRLKHDSGGFHKALITHIFMEITQRISRAGLEVIKAGTECVRRPELCATEFRTSVFIFTEEQLADLLETAKKEEREALFATHMNRLKGSQFKEEEPEDDDNN